MINPLIAYALLAGDPIPAVVWAVIYFVVTVIVGYIIALIAAVILRRLLPGLAKQIGLSMDMVNTSIGGVEATIMLISIAIALTYITPYLGMASTYVTMIADYLPYLAGLIILLTLGLLLVDALTLYIQRRVGAEEYISLVMNILRFGLYAVLITIAVTWAIFHWITAINPYLFYDIIIGSVVLYAGISIVNKAVSDISKAHPEMSGMLDYGKLVLYAVIILVAIAIIVQPFPNVTQVLYALAWGLAIAFAIVVAPLAYAMAKKALT
ncbi:hypothetical protein [Caldivirga maquilingensis]|uniref:Conserved TM helix repeat-containing protein n=1 Tax=Caldivirga maquilingensis (strain ATCC 700844 / DSM 13496 / JCM 10307 / IC-167) TaxID=397948 RepID=A8MBY3_CALMQ|nr:hypothetical protein [Caldivirga maquilingensis]ABW01326.1 Conserved TM helix repeat-containing protein [Caldivirga maquilingensis IC-167]